MNIRVWNGSPRGTRRTAPYAALHLRRPMEDDCHDLGMEVFRDLIWTTRRLMKAGRRFCKAQGVCIYGFPRKQRGRMLAMCALGEIVCRPRTCAKTGNKMNEGIAAPYSAAAVPRRAAQDRAYK